MLNSLKVYLEDKGYVVKSIERMPNDFGSVIRLENGVIVNVYDTKKTHCQGKDKEKVKEVDKVVEQFKLKNSSKNKKVFVVYGHDKDARSQLELMLRRLDLEPIILDQIASSSKTIIEKLEENISEAVFGIVLATPDDMGRSCISRKECYRVRQNVVLELGMLLAKLGRKHVAILKKVTKDFEDPSDIAGLIYIPYENSVEETQISLLRELTKAGLYIDLTRL